MTLQISDHALRQCARHPMMLMCTSYNYPTHTEMWVGSIGNVTAINNIHKKREVARMKKLKSHFNWLVG